MDEPDWSIPVQLQPVAAHYAFDIDRRLQSVVGIKADIPAEAFTAPILGTERTGSGVLIRQDGLVVTIGYLVTEAQTVWLTLADGAGMQGDVIGIDQASGLALVQALGRIKAPAVELGDSRGLEAGTSGVFAAAGGRHHAVRTDVVARREFAGYWEYLLERAIFTCPAHPFWGGGALLDNDGKLLGVGSLILQASESGGQQIDMNMTVPIDLLPPVMDDLLTRGRSSTPPRPWMGVYCGESDGAIIVHGLAPKGPADRAGVKRGDRVVKVGGVAVSDLASLWRAAWALGNAGTPIPLTLQRGGDERDVLIATVDRASLLWSPKRH